MSVKSINQKIIQNIEYIKDQYLNYNKSSASLAKEFNCNEKTISSNLRKIGVKTKRNTKQNLKQDLNGLIFGRLTIIGLDGYNNFGNYIWTCKCKCGNTIKQEAAHLLCKSYGIKSCGCARKQNCSWDCVPPYCYGTFKAKAKIREINFNISLEYCDQLFKNQNKLCAISGVLLSFGRRKDSSSTTASLDRIDSNLPYIEGNVQWVHKKINIMKNSLSHEEFIEWCKIIAENNK